MFAALALTALVASAVATPLSSPDDLFKQVSSGCGTNGVASCSSSASGSCCLEAPGGVLLQTQFWDTDPSTGPANSWTIHGLWSNHCNGTRIQHCDSSRDYADIKGLLTEHGASATLDYMQDYWLNNYGTDEELWKHEWAAHGTCYSTLKPSCFGSRYYEGQEAVVFYETVVALFKTLPTYTWLEASGIVPSDSVEYEWAAVLAALKKNGNGMTPAVACHSGSISAISWYFNVKGPLVDGDFVAINSPRASTCSGKVKYPTKSWVNRFPYGQHKTFDSFLELQQTRDLRGFDQDDL